MFGFLKNLLGKSETKPFQNQAPGSSPHQAKSGSTPTAVAQAPALRPGSRNGRNGNGNGNGQSHSFGKEVEVPLQPVLDALPLELQNRVLVKEAGNSVLYIPLERILAQLAQGVIKVSFGEVRQSAPQLFSPEPDQDMTLVPLPLSEVLSRLNPALLKRRRVQRRIEVPDEVSSPFGENGRGLAVPTTPPKSDTTQYRPTALPGSPHHSPAPGVPISRKNTLTPSPLVPPSAGPAPLRMPLPSSRLSPVPPPSAPGPLPSPSPIPLSRSNLGQSPPTPVPSAPSLQLPKAGSPTVNPAANAEFISVGLVSLAENWSEAIRKEIVELKLVDARIALPTEAVELGLRRGRISFPWRILRSWIKPSPLPTVSAQDAAELEIPLKIIAPLFLARQKAAANARQKITIDADIPNLFFGFPQPETPSAGNGSAASNPTDTNFYVWDDAADKPRRATSDSQSPSAGTKFVSKYATPNEIVSRTSSLDGVEGALIALPDGLLVASKLSNGLNADTLAAFLPEIFGKVSQTTKELRMGDLNNLNFTVGNVPWKIFRVNAIFFAAFGRAGEPLPTAQLAALAAELDHKPK
jgi:predicted regulator of Ras-like GTPase activity (Roadblock/LC7/MglB family)